MNKVDVMVASKGLDGGSSNRPPGKVTHAPYRREPYIRVRFPNGTVVDAKAAAWTRTYVLAHWMDQDAQAHNEWVPATAVKRIPRDESNWRDPYDLLE